MSHIPIPYLTEKDIRRFWSKVDKTPGQGPHGDCWIWIGSKTKSGYGRFRLRITIDGDFRAVRIIWFLTRKCDPGELLIRHVKCRNTSCVNPEHLKLGTTLDNMRDKIIDGTVVKGEDVHLAKLKIPEVISIRNLWKENKLTTKEIAIKFNVTESNILLIITGETWKSVENSVSEGETEHLKSTRNRHAKLTIDDVRAIRALRDSGVPYKILSNKFGIGERAIRRICNNERWVNIE